MKIGSIYKFPANYRQQKLLWNQIWKTTDPVIKVLDTVFVMSCPVNMNNGDWQVAHWTKLSHRRNLFKCENHFVKEYTLKNTIFGAFLRKYYSSPLTTQRIAINVIFYPV